MRTAKGVRQDLLREEKKARKGTFNDSVITAAAEDLLRKGEITQDSFQNFMISLGIGTDNATTGNGYGFNPVTRNRILLEWIHRGSWIGGVAVDVVAQDMTRRGVDFLGEIDPGDAEDLHEYATALNLWGEVADTVSWARLYGGALMVPLIDGQNMATPLRINTITKGQLKGFLTLDRWQVVPHLENLVSDYGPDFGLPKFYTVTGDAPGLNGQRIHYSRVLRLEGVRLPYWQRVIENLWGISVYERLYDRMTGFDSATQGAAQLVYRSWLRHIKIKGLREVVASGGQAMTGLVKYVDMMRRFQSIEGIALIDGDDEYSETGATGSFAGLAEALVQFGQQLSGALQIPLVRLFGQSPAGLNSTGESDLRMYYDGINQQQERWLRVPLTRMYRAMAQSMGLKLERGFKLAFNPLWQLTEEQESAIGAQDTATAAQGQQLGIPLETCLRELKDRSKVSRVWTTLTDEDIENAKVDEAPIPDEPDMPEAKSLTGDSAVKASLGMSYYHNLPVVIEYPQGHIHRGNDFEITMPADYGYIRGVKGADGDQLDCYIGPSHQSKQVYVVDQLDPESGDFDEHKVMLGYLTPETAEEEYRLGHTRSDETFGGMTAMSMDDFKSRLGSTWLKPLGGRA